jgi:hypothetical protein
VPGFERAQPSNVALPLPNDRLFVEGTNRFLLQMPAMHRPRGAKWTVAPQVRTCVRAPPADFAARPGPCRHAAAARAPPACLDVRRL